MFIKMFVERTVSVLGRDLLVSVLSFMVTTYLAKAFGAEIFGLWIGVITLLALLDLAFRLKIDQLIIFYSKEYPSNLQLYKKVSAISVYALIVGGVILLFLNVLIVDFFNLGSGYFLALIFFTFILSVFGNISFYILLSEAKYSAYNFAILIQSLSTAVLVFSFFYFFESSIILALLAHLLSWMVVLLFFILCQHKDKQMYSNKTPDLSSKDILVKGSYIYTSSAVRSMADQVPRLFAISFLGSTFVGNLGLVQVIVGLINRVPSAINTVLYPMLARESGDELIRSVGIVRALLILFIPVILILAMAIPYLITTFYGSSFEVVALYVRILLPFIYLGLPGIILVSYFASRGEFNVLFIINFGVVIASITSLYGISLLSTEYAPIVALCSSFASGTIFSLLFVSKRVVLAEFIPRKQDLVRVFSIAKSLLRNSNVPKNL